MLGILHDIATLRHPSTRLHDDVELLSDEELRRFTERLRHDLERDQVERGTRPRSLGRIEDARA